MTRFAPTTALLAGTLLAGTLLAGSTSIAAAAGLEKTQGRPMGGLAMSMRDEQAMEAASMDRKKPTAMHRRKMFKRHMMHNAMH